MNLRQIFDIVSDGLDLIGRLVKNRKVEDAARVLDAIQAVWEAIDGAATRRISPADATRELQRLHSELNENDAVVDKALHDKFE